MNALSEKGRNAKENRDYLFQKYCEGHGAEKTILPMNKLLDFIRKPLLQFDQRGDADVWQFSAIQLESRTPDVLGGATGMLILRDFIEQVQIEANRYQVCSKLTECIFLELAGHKLRRDLIEISETRQKMEANSKKDLEDVKKELELEARIDQIRAVMTRNFESLTSDVNSETQRRLQRERAELEEEQKKLAIERGDFAETNLADSPDARFEMDHGVDDDTPTMGNSDYAGSINGDTFNKLLAEAENGMRKEKEREALMEHERQTRISLSLNKEENVELTAKLKKYDDFAYALETEKWNMLRLYACFIDDISPRIIAEITFLGTEGTLLEITRFQDAAEIKRVFNLIKPYRRDGRMELYDVMALKSLTFQAFYVYIYHISHTYAKIYDAILRRPIKSNVDEIAMRSSQHAAIIDEINEMALVLKYFWGQAIFKQITASGDNEDDTGLLAPGRILPYAMRGLTVMESRRITVPDRDRMHSAEVFARQRGEKYTTTYIFKTDTITCSPFDVLIKFCRGREQFYLGFQTFILQFLADKEIVVATLMYKNRNNPLKHIVLNKINDFYPHDMWGVIRAFDPALEHKLECIQNKTVQLLKFGASGGEKQDPFMEMLNYFEAQIRDYIAGKRPYITAMASLYMVYLTETYFTRHENIRHVDEQKFETTWASRYFLPRITPRALCDRACYDSEPFIAKWTGGMYILRQRSNEFMVSDILTILYKYKEEVASNGGILFNDVRYCVDDFLEFIKIEMHKFS
jgi:hypothetical protein